MVICFFHFKELLDVRLEQIQSWVVEKLGNFTLFVLRLDIQIRVVTAGDDDSDVNVLHFRYWMNRYERRSPAR